MTGGSQIGGRIGQREEMAAPTQDVVQRESKFKKVNIELSYVNNDYYYVELKSIVNSMLCSVESNKVDVESSYVNNNYGYVELKSIVGSILCNVESCRVNVSNTYVDQLSRHMYVY